MGADRDDDGMLGAEPHGEQAIVAVEVPAADMVEFWSGQPVPSRLAPEVEELGEDRPGPGGATAS